MFDHVTVTCQVQNVQVHVHVALQVNVTHKQQHLRFCESEMNLRICVLHLVIFICLTSYCEHKFAQNAIEVKFNLRVIHIKFHPCSAFTNLVILLLFGEVITSTIFVARCMMYIAQKNTLSGSIPPEVLKLRTTVLYIQCI